jgi:hypothetical protein
LGPLQGLLNVWLIGLGKLAEGLLEMVSLMGLDIRRIDAEVSRDIRNGLLIQQLPIDQGMRRMEA